MHKIPKSHSAPKNTKTDQVLKASPMDRICHIPLQRRQQIRHTRMFNMYFVILAFLALMYPFFATIDYA